MLGSWMLVQLWSGFETILQRLGAIRLELHSLVTQQVGSWLIRFHTLGHKILLQLGISYNPVLRQQFPRTNKM
jgi:hypothetical protein